MYLVFPRYTETKYAIFLQLDVGNRDIPERRERPAICKLENVVP